MTMPTLGTLLIHPLHGEGTVTFVGSDYFGFRLADGRDVLLKPAGLQEPPPSLEQPAEEPLPWPGNTFRFEEAGARHYLRSHWEPFSEDRNFITGRLEEIFSSARPGLGYGEAHRPPRPVPETWTQGITLIWPTPRHGVALVGTGDGKAIHLASFFPFIESGSQIRVELQHVDVWEGGVEAQVTASWGEVEISFFDTRHLTDRGWYEAGREYEFIVTGLAYAAQPARVMKLPYNPHPDQVAWEAQLHRDRGQESVPVPKEMSLDGFSMLLPIAQWDRDDFQFRGPVTAVKQVPDVLGQDAHLVTVVVVRGAGGAPDQELEILITSRAWTGEEPPRVGQQVEGQMWLQGYLWNAKPQRLP
jgi:hypothetical protein